MSTYHGRAIRVDNTSGNSRFRHLIHCNVQRRHTSICHHSLLNISTIAVVFRCHAISTHRQLCKFKNTGSIGHHRVCHRIFLEINLYSGIVLLTCNGNFAVQRTSRLLLNFQVLNHYNHTLALCKIVAETNVIISGRHLRQSDFNLFSIIIFNFFIKKHGMGSLIRT